MASVAIIAIFIAEAHFGVAVSLPSGSAASAYANTPDGVAKLERWLESLPGPPTQMHSCVAVDPPASPGAYESAAMEFAHDDTTNTFIWPTSDVAAVLAEGAKEPAKIAQRMLPSCVASHAKAGR